MYQPQPLDTLHIELPADLQDLLEVLARNTHEVWAKQRMDDGWVYGAERHDALLQHPCLVAYEQLPEAEKDYDRNTAREVLKMILAAGFTIQKGE